MQNTRIEIVEALTESQLQMIKAMEQEAFGPHGAINEWVLVPLARHGCVALFMEAEEAYPVGVCQLLRDFRQPDKCYMYGYYIRADRKGMGYGFSFLNRLLEQLREDGFRQICLTVSPDNTGAVGLYQKAGFAVIETRIAEYGSGNDRYYMVKTL
ncbi:GNAT family N-acetyltransferase [Brevibacillus brevis]|uniref:GNAT family N-acetyltransferase n=1 Tax=Brevibacillus brevis TaxID=1393 RepID=UPI000B38A3FC|nr:GNAT family N-acetyltransferase [Brevibacillus brevis]OUQ86681.1 GNAT family N-acetyltransferase [Brevibacillus brevis]